MKKLALKTKPKSKLYENLNYEIIKISTDKLRLSLLKFQKALPQRYSLGIPAGMVFTFLATMVATEKYRDTLFLSAAVWEAIFNIGFWLSFVWLAAAFVGMLRNWKFGSVESLIMELKGLGEKRKIRKNRNALLNFLASKQKLP